LSSCSLHQYQVVHYIFNVSEVLLHLNRKWNFDKNCLNFPHPFITHHTHHTPHTSHTTHITTLVWAKHGWNTNHKLLNCILGEFDHFCISLQAWVKIWV
jgi:HD-like signal output (HDOD) protein